MGWFDPTSEDSDCPSRLFLLVEIPDCTWTGFLLPFKVVECSTGFLLPFETEEASEGFLLPFVAIDCPFKFVLSFEDCPNGFLFPLLELDDCPREYESCSFPPKEWRPDVAVFPLL